MKVKKGIDKKLDDAWSLLVKLEAGLKCEYCNVQSPLNSHHIFSRSNVSTRWSITNGICLCVGHHTMSSKFSAHKTPTEFTKWIYTYKGDNYMDNLALEARRTVKFSVNEKIELLTKLTNRINELKAI